MSSSRLKLELCKESLPHRRRPRSSRSGRTKSSSRCGVSSGRPLALVAPCQVVSPQLARQAATGFSQEEVRLAHKLMFSHHELDWPSMKKLRDHRNALYAEQNRLRWKANELFTGEAHTSQHLRVEQLLRENADPSSPDRLGRTALMEAAFSGRLKVLEALVKAGAQLEARSELGETALTVAATNGPLNVVKALLQAGAETEACDVDCLISVGTQGHPKVLEALLKAGVPLEARDERGRTALLAAAGLSNVHLVDALVRAGAQLEARDKYGTTTLISAAEIDNLEVVEVLIKAGAQLEASCSLGTALTVAADNGHLRVVEVLLKAGAQLEARDEDGNTALMWAAASGHLKVVETLLAAGAQIETRSADGFTALTWAVDEGQLQVVEALLKAGAHAEALDKKLAQHKGHLQIVDILCKTIESIKLCSPE